MGVACDVGSADSVRSMVDLVLEEFGAIHVLHNNAASKSENLAAFFAPYTDYSLEEWRKIMSVNLDGMFPCAQDSRGAQMIEQGGERDPSSRRPRSMA